MDLSNEPLNLPPDAGRPQGKAIMQRHFVLSVSEAEAIRLYRILLDRDQREALGFLEEHARKRLHDFFEGG